MNFDLTLIRYLVGFIWGMLFGIWLVERKWKSVFDTYHEGIRRVVKDHDCGLARRNGWTLEDETNAVERPRILQ